MGGHGKKPDYTRKGGVKGFGGLRGGLPPPFSPNGRKESTPLSAPKGKLSSDGLLDRTGGGGGWEADPNSASWQNYSPTLEREVTACPERTLGCGVFPWNEDKKVKGAEAAV